MFSMETPSSTSSRPESSGVCQGGRIRHTSWPLRCRALAIGIARELGVQVVAEGVENRNQRDVLFERGCTRMQGFLFGRPIPAAELESELARRLPSWIRGVGGD